MAQCALEYLDDAVLYVVVANDPWQKSAERSVTPARHRLAMARLAFANLKKADLNRADRNRANQSRDDQNRADLNEIVVSDLEIRRGGPSYMIDTVAEVERPGTATVLVMGSSAASGVSTWHRAAELADRVNLLVVQPRTEPAVQVEGWRTEMAHMSPIDASATRMREVLSVRDRREIPAEAKQCLPQAVLSYIVEHALYAS